MNFKKTIINIYERVMLVIDFFILKNVKRHPEILSFNETICSIKSTNKSLCRFGDGEFAIMNGHNIKFQRYNPTLAKRLKKIIATNEDGLLISLPDIFLPNHKYTKETNDYWTKEIAKYRLMIYKLINRDRIFGNAFISRPYMNWIDKEGAYIRFQKLFELWENKSVLIVEGEKTRMGVGNDIFKSTISIKRILIPSENAFCKYNEILNTILENYKGELVIISAGPTAKVLVYDLYIKGVQAIDLGHIDIEYEWFIRSAKEKIKIDGKYTAEVENGERVEGELNDQYISQVIRKII